MLVNEESLYNIIQDTWTSTLGFQVECRKAAEVSTVGEYTVCVRITGAWDGEVHMHCPMPLARLIASAIFQVDPSKAGSDEILDALSELTHIVGGNLKALLPKPVTLSLPCIVEPQNSAETPEEGEALFRVTLMSEGYPFIVSLFEHHPTVGLESIHVDHRIWRPEGSP
jgi:CheY-specific phosphatase CheX